MGERVISGNIVTGACKRSPTEAPRPGIEVGELTAEVIYSRRAGAIRSARTRRLDRGGLRPIRSRSVMNKRVSLIPQDYHGVDTGGAARRELQRQQRYEQDAQECAADCRRVRRADAVE